MKLLLLEDDVAVRRLVTNHLEQQGFTVTVATTVAEAMRKLNHDTFDVAILDLTLPDGSGLDVLHALRALGATTHVTVLSGAGAEIDRIGALDLGADDYVVKPFFVRELTARILAVQRRRASSDATELDYGPLHIDIAAREVSIDGVQVHLPTKEFDVLACMATHPGRVFSRDELLRTVWQSAADWQRASTVTEHIRRLRSKIEVDPLNPRILRTARGAGYRFDPPTDAGETAEG
ncbi:MAG: two-component system, OmpR family, phosphate regulon response regulator OmpR [Actinomycetota bacterium]|jgi:DNA-binding response OmpR family regulator|nr:two-component system, OmpR family, phosphate regulon response regulator OmpR [Actinomycetota bacterium]